METKQLATLFGSSRTHQLELKRQIDIVLDRYLDAGHGSCDLKRPDIASIVAENLHYHDGSRYELKAWCIMPNHVHVIVRLFPASTLGGTLKNWKSYTSRRALAILNRAAPFWQREYHDRIVWDQDDYDKTLSYLLENPIKAGLHAWPWIWSKGSVTAAGRS